MTAAKAHVKRPGSFIVNGRAMAGFSSDNAPQTSKVKTQSYPWNGIIRPSRVILAVRIPCMNFTRLAREAFLGFE
jgi:hypothetical protein